MDLEAAAGDGGGFYTSGADGRPITMLVEDSYFRENYNLLSIRGSFGVGRHREVW